MHKCDATTCKKLWLQISKNISFLSACLDSFLVGIELLFYLIDTLTMHFGVKNVFSDLRKVKQTPRF